MCRNHPYVARDANFHCAFFVLKSVMLTSGLDLMFVVAWKGIATTRFVFSMDTKKVFKNKNGGREKFIRRIFYIPLPLAEAILKRIL